MYNFRISKLLPQPPFGLRRVARRGCRLLELIKCRGRGAAFIKVPAFSGLVWGSCNARTPHPSRFLNRLSPIRLAAFFQPSHRSFVLVASHDRCHVRCLAFPCCCHVSNVSHSKGQSLSSRRLTLRHATQWTQRSQCHA